MKSSSISGTRKLGIITMLELDKITMFWAHPDDEVIFGFPLLGRVKKIICCSSDIDNPLRKWCRDRKLALMEIGRVTGAEIVCLDYSSDFYKLNSRDGSLNHFCEEVKRNLGGEEIIFTHNPWGEYGHLDHILVHHIARLSKKPLVFSDTAIFANWFTTDPMATKYLNIKPIGSFNNDLYFYDKYKAIYDKYGCWTWSQPPLQRINLYVSGNGDI